MPQPDDPTKAKLSILFNHPIPTSTNSPYQNVYSPFSTRTGPPSPSPYGYSRRRSPTYSPTDSHPASQSRNSNPLSERSGEDGTGTIQEVDFEANRDDRERNGDSRSSAGETFSTKVSPISASSAADATNAPDAAGEALELRSLSKLQLLSLHFYAVSDDDAIVLNQRTKEMYATPRGEERVHRDTSFCHAWAYPSKSLSLVFYHLQNAVLYIGSFFNSSFLLPSLYDSLSTPLLNALTPNFNYVHEDSDFLHVFAMLTHVEVAGVNQRCRRRGQRGKRDGHQSGAELGYRGYSTRLNTLMYEKHNRSNGGPRRLQMLDESEENEGNGFGDNVDDPGDGEGNFED
ncbi:hypothetical protein C8R42DRAFT_648803 [Lentinula raphanica]|nr:hypothetical protein C8R42DRAFT_648803 [Lentinula raphanica]